MTKRHLWVAVALGTLSLAMAACTSNAPTSSSTSTSVPTSTSTTSSSASTRTAVWPTASGSTRFGTPEEAARSFATDYLHMVDPVVGQFQQGDSRSGEVPVQPSSTGPVTTVMVRQLGSDNSWWVLGAATTAIRLTDPAWNASITSPVTLKGSAMAFEGTVQTQVREDGTSKPLGEGFVTGGMEMTPFSGSLAFSKSNTRYGAVVLFTVSAKDGSVVEASVIRIQFG